MTSSEYCLVLTTFADDENGQQMIDALISSRLAACVQVMPIQSYYHWQGDVRCDGEKLVLIKTRTSLYEQVEASLIANHAYDTPEIVQVPIAAGFAGYLEWISNECQ